MLHKINNAYTAERELRNVSFFFINTPWLMEKCPYHVDIITERVTRQFLITVSISRGLWTQQSVVQDQHSHVPLLNWIHYSFVLCYNQISVCTHVRLCTYRFVWKNYIDHAKLHIQPNSLLTLYSFIVYLSVTAVLSYRLQSQ